MKSKILRLLVLVLLVAVSIGILSACQLKEPDTSTLFYINEAEDSDNIHDEKEEDAISNVTDGIENLRKYLNSSVVTDTGYYMGIDFNINTINKNTKQPANFRLSVKAHLYTNPYIDDEGRRTYQFQDKRGIYEDEKYNAYYFNEDEQSYMLLDNLIYESATTMTGGEIAGVSVKYHYDMTLTIPSASVASDFVLGEDRYDTEKRVFYKKTQPEKNTDGEVVIYYKEKTAFVDVSTVTGKTFVDSEIVHNEVIKKSDVMIEWYNGDNNETLLGFYFDGVNSNLDDPGNILYLDIQGERDTGARRYFTDFGDTVLYRQIIRLLMSLSVEQLLVEGNLQGDAGMGSIEEILGVAITDNYNVIYNDKITSTYFYNVNADMLKGDLTEMIQNMFAVFEDKVDPLTLKYLGFKFSVMGVAMVNSLTADMQFFTQAPFSDENGDEMVSAANFNLAGIGASGQDLYDYVVDVAFEYGAYPPEPLIVDRKERYVFYDYGNYEFVGNLYVPMLDSNFDTLIRTDMNQFDNSTNNVYITFSDISNGNLMAGVYYKNETSYIDITGMEDYYGAIELEDLGFPKVYDESLNLAEMLASMFDAIDEMIISIVDGILTPKTDDRKNMLLQYIMDKTHSTEKTEDDIFSKNTVTLRVDMELIKQALEETGNGTFTTRDIINILDSMSPYSMDQLATILGVASAEVMLDKTYFTFTINTDTNEITIKMFTDVGKEEGEPSAMIFQLDLTPTHIGEKVKIAEVDFSDFKPLQEIYTYSATMKGSFIFSTKEEVDLSQLLSATFGEGSGYNTPYKLPTSVGLTFELVYDQFVTDQYVDGVLKQAGRSSFNLKVFLSGGGGTLIFQLSSDDVSFNNDVYQGLPETADQLGYVWVNIECVYEGTERKIPKIKVREDIFMNSMQAYMNGTAISDDVGELGASDVNLSVTSIITALAKDAYVVLQPEQIDITTSNETVQNLFRVDNLIGNIEVDAGFRYRVFGLENSKADYGKFEVGYFKDMIRETPYETILHDEINVYFYEDYTYTSGYDEFNNTFRVATENNDKLQVYDLQGRVSIFREPIEVPSGSFFEKEKAENQNINEVRFLYSVLKVDSQGEFKDYSDLAIIVQQKVDDTFYYIDYEGKERLVDINYIKEETTIEGEVKTTKTYIYYKGLRNIVTYKGGTEYYFYDVNHALTDEEGDFIFLDAQFKREMLFKYDPASIEITADAKTQYAPRIEGSFMGVVRRYTLEITSTLPKDRGNVTKLSNLENVYYSDEDRDNVKEILDKDGVVIDTEPNPITLFVMEPSLPLADEVNVMVQIDESEEETTLPARFVIDWESITLRGEMILTDVIVAEGTMGERIYPVRIIVTNREIISDIDSGTGIYPTEEDVLYENVPVVDTISIDPYDFILAKYEYFSNTLNYNPSNWGTDKYLIEYQAQELKFINEYFSKYDIVIKFDANGSILKEKEVKDKYIAKTFTNENTKLEWNLDKNPLATNNIERNITPSGSTIFLHTYFYGQLIALRVNVEKRSFDHIEFYEGENFDEVESTVRAEENIPDDVEINGFYSANYFDTESYTIQKNPIFVFLDANGREHRRVFDFTRIIGLDVNNNYISEIYGTTWADPVIDNIGENGSYYEENGDVVNYPFVGTEYDFTSSSLDLRHTLKLFKRGNRGTLYPINIISGDENSDWFSAIPLRIWVSCPKQDVDKVRKYDYGVVDETRLDKVLLQDNANGDIDFEFSTIKIGNNPLGIYEIDPLNRSTWEIPTTATIYFVNKDGETRIDKGDEFKNIKWENCPGSVEVIKKNITTNRYEFRLSVDESMFTRIQANIGTESDPQIITLAIEVLSKEPRKIEFYSSAILSESNRIKNMEKTILENGGETYVEYAYYVDTFSNFNLPTNLKVYFGSENNSREEVYNVEWTKTQGGRQYSFAPNSVVYLKTQLGDNDEQKVNVYLTVIVANHTIDNIEMNRNLKDKYCLVKNDDNTYEYVLLSDLFFYNAFDSSLTYDKFDQHIVVSLARDLDNGVDMGKIGIFTSSTEGYKLENQYYPNEFVSLLYSRVSISFKNKELVDIWRINDSYEESEILKTDGTRAKIIDIVDVNYTFNMTGDYLSTEVSLPDVKIINGKVTIYNGGADSTGVVVDIRELLSALAMLDICTPIDELGGAISDDELSYRTTYLAKYRTSGAVPPAINNKEIEIKDLKSIFDINNLIYESGKSYSDEYKIVLGTGAESYDVQAKIMFADGLMGDISSISTTEEVNVYNNIGSALYGANGYELGKEISVSLEAIRKDGTGLSQLFIYESGSGALVEWYVVSSDFAEIEKGTFITKISQEIVYSAKEGSIIISTMTREGFRITKEIVFYGIDANLSDYDSLGVTDFEIEDGGIVIENAYEHVVVNENYYSEVNPTLVYRYHDLSTKLGFTNYLPTNIQTKIGDDESKNFLRISNVEWEINPGWYERLVNSETGRPAENGTLTNIDYKGTSDRELIATARILGWQTKDEDGNLVYKNQVEIKLYIEIKSVEAVALPWKNQNPYFDTMSVGEDENKIFVVDVDPFVNNSSVSLFDGKVMLEKPLRVQYESGLIYNFENIEYLYSNNPAYALDYIPYGVYGIDNEELGELMPAEASNLSGNDCDVEADLGLGQTIKLRYHIFDKTLESITPIISINDEKIRTLLGDRFSYTKEINALMDTFNTTRIMYNLDSLVDNVRKINNLYDLPILTESDFAGVTDEEAKDILKGILESSLNVPSILPDQSAGFTPGEAHPQTYSYKLAYNSLKSIFNMKFITNVGSILSKIYVTSGKPNYNDANRQLEKFMDDVMLSAYDRAIYDYLQEETATKIMSAFLGEISDIERQNNSIFAKNYLESAFDIDGMIKELAFLNRMYVANNITMEEAQKEVAKVVVNSYCEDVINQLSTLSDMYSQTALDTIIGAFRYNINEKIGNFINYWAVNSLDIADFRQKANDLIEFNLSGAELDIIIPIMFNNNFANNASINNSVVFIKNDILNNVSYETVLKSVLERTVSNYYETIYKEMEMVEAIERAIEFNESQDKSSFGDEFLYFIDPYDMFIIIPTKYIVDFEQNISGGIDKGGYGYITEFDWDNDSVTGNVKYYGNADSDDLACFETFVYLAENGTQGVKDNINTLYADKVALNGSDELSWDFLVENNYPMYTRLMQILEWAKEYFEYEKTLTDEQREIEEKVNALSIYNKLSVISDILVTPNSDPIYKKNFNRNKYNLLTSVLMLGKTRESQEVNLLVNVIDRSEEELIKLIDNNGNVLVDNTCVINNPFDNALDKLPKIARVGGVDYKVIWNDVVISPMGNLEQEDKTVYGNIVNGQGQRVSMNLVVYKWEYRAIYSYDKDNNLKYMNPINIYTNKYLTYSAQDRYCISFNVFQPSGASTTAERVFYPEDSILLVNSTNDAQMNEVKQRRQSVMYWEEGALTTAKSGKAVIGSTLYLGNSEIGRYSLSDLAPEGSSLVQTKVNYYNEGMFLDGLYLSGGIDTDDALFSQIENSLYGNKQSTTMVVGVDKILPQTAEIKFYSNYVKYDMSQVSVRLLWNKTYDKALSDLVAFVESKHYSTAVLSSSEINARAKSLLLESGRDAEEEKDLIEKAMEYIADNVGKLKPELVTDEQVDNYLASDLLYLDACQLLMIERFDYVKNPTFTKGGIDSTQTVEVVVVVGNNPNIFKKTYIVRMTHLDMTATKLYNDDPIKTEITKISESTIIIPSMYLGVRKDYWNRDLSQNSYDYEGLNSRYDTEEDYIYKLLQLSSDVRDLMTKDNLYLVKVVNVILGETTNGIRRSKSFQVVYNINGVEKCSGIINSDLISIRVG